MAYDPKKKGADSIYMTDEDLKQLDQYKSDFAAAQTAGDQAGMNAAHTAAENLRKKYNYSGGADGSQFNILSSEGVKQPFSYENAPQMVDEYQGLIDKLTDKYLNRPAFSYDAESDPLYQMYKEQYTAAGKQAMEDTLGSVSARTGGLASSYATSAAQQANNAYMDALAAKIPELQQLAYQMYQNEGATLESQINMLMALQSGDWDRYQTELAQYNADKSFAYGQYADDRAYNYQIGRDEESTAYEQGLQKAALLAQSGIFSGYADIFGLTEDETAALVKQYAKNEKMSDQEAAMALADWYLSHGDINSAVNAFQFDPSYIKQMQNAELASLYSSGSSGSSKSGSKGSGTSGKTQDYEGLFMSALESGHPKSFIANNYKKYGFTSSSGLYDEYESMLEAGELELDPGYEDVDTDSVAALGYGPISTAQLESLEEQGLVEGYIDQSTGKIKYKKKDNSSIGGNWYTSFDSLIKNPYSY